MVAEDLVELEGRLSAAALLEPTREPLVELCAERLRHRSVRDLTDEDVTEAVRIVAGGERALRQISSLRIEGREVRVDVDAQLVGHELRDRAAMEHLTLDGAALQHDAHVAVERVDAGLEERLDRGRHRDLATALFANHGEHLFDVERIAR